MAEALETKKRRLYKLLDNLSSSDINSKTSTASTTSSAKRSLTASERFEEARERASKRLRHSTSTGSASSLPTKVAPPRTVPTKQDGGDKAPPNFSPWSHDMFLARLKSFSSVSLWHPKPERISEVEWAKRGWRCVDVNTVACKGGCEKRVVVSLQAPVRKQRTETKAEDEVDAEEEDDGEQEAFERALVERYKEVIANGHAGHCMWRASGCRDDIYRVQVVRPSVWQPELRKRCASLLKLSSSIQALTLKASETDGVKTQSASRLINDLPRDLIGVDTLSSSDTTISDRTTKALTIALHGWRGAREAGSDLLHCDACFQRIGLWMYQPDYKRRRLASPTDDEDNEDDVTMTLDLTELHREHCPWRNPASQHASGSLAGLNASQILQRVVATYARDLRRRSAEQVPALDGAADKEEEQHDDGGTMPPVKASKEEVAKQDKERESRMRKLKSLFSVRRRKTVAKPG